MVRVCGVAPAIREEGDNDVTVGTGLLGDATVIIALPDLVES
jgi:hypothetical protein